MNQPPEQNESDPAGEDPPPEKDEDMRDADIANGERPDE